MKALRGRGAGKGAFFLPNLIVEKANMMQAGTSAIVTRTDVGTGDRLQTARNHDSSVNLTVSVLLFRIREETRRDRKCDSSGSRRCFIKIWGQKIIDIPSTQLSLLIIYSR
jgi:hypothetical protein